MQFQLKAIRALLESMEESQRDIILKSPTGSGKTIILTHFMDEYMQGHSKTVFVWLTPGKGNLEEQSKAKMDAYIHNAQTKLLADVMTSGFAEMVSSLSHAVTLFLFNRAFKGMLGIDGVAALTIASYSTYVFNSVFYGFSEATAAIIGFKYGRKDWAGLKKVFGNAVKTALAFSGMSFLLSILFYEPVLAVFTAPGTNVYAIVAGSFTLYATTLLFSGSNMFAAYFFTAFGDGRRAAILSFCRTFLFMILAIETLPLLLGEPGLWLALPASECLSFATALVFILMNARRYGYDGRPALLIREG